ncbi:hypothetical protein ACIPTZ_19520 [Pectobacterium sp. CHL-2024]|uniref:hypothetical protein n=1 Tax=Pectobacterium sp. CHL-2024 TaxID=3377079 RepID=UPI00382AF8BB
MPASTRKQLNFGGTTFVWGLGRLKSLELLEANQPLNTFYVMKAALKELWYAPDDAGSVATLG